MNILIRCGVMAWAFALAGCASAPMHYYTLLPPSTAMMPETSPVPFVIDVLPVGVPVQLDQPQLVVRQGDNGVAILDSHRWVAPLSDELRAALSAYLVQRLGTQDVAGLPPPTSTPVLRIKLHVHRFDAWVGKTVQLDADWSLSFANDQRHAHLICSGQFNEAAPGDYTELVRAQQRAIASLAAQVAEDASQWSRSGQAMCSVEAPSHAR